MQPRGTRPHRRYSGRSSRHPVRMVTRCLTILGHVVQMQRQCFGNRMEKFSEVRSAISQPSRLIRSLSAFMCRSAMQAEGQATRRISLLPLPDRARPEGSSKTPATCRQSMSRIVLPVNVSWSLFRIPVIRFEGMSSSRTSPHAEGSSGFVNSGSISSSAEVVPHGAEPELAVDPG